MRSAALGAALRCPVLPDSLAVATKFCWRAMHMWQKLPESAAVL